LWIYSATDIAKYVPGGVWAVDGRVFLYRREGIQIKHLSLARFVENLAFAVSAFLFSIPVAWWYLRTYSISFQVLILAILVLAGGLVAYTHILSHLKYKTYPLKVLVDIWPGIVFMVAGWGAIGTSYYVLMSQ